MEIVCRMYRLSQAGILANQPLYKDLEPRGYYEVEQKPGLWKHNSLPIQFTLIVDSFGVKYIDEENVLHLVNALKQN